MRLFFFNKLINLVLIFFKISTNQNICETVTIILRQVIFCIFFSVIALP